MKKQTAVEWFFNQLIDKKNQTPEILWAAYLNAKAMEKEQIIDAFEVKKNRYVKKFYSDDTYSTVNEIIYTDGNQYYSETYGGDK
jgi:hypothetical protein